MEENQQQPGGDWEKVDIGLKDMVDWEVTKSLTGKLVDIQTEVGPNNSNIYTFEKDDSSRVSFWGNTVLDGKFKIIELGTLCKVNYLGKVDGKNNRNYKNFEVFTKK